MKFNKLNLFLLSLLFIIGYFGYRYFFKSTSSTTTYQTSTVEKGPLVVSLTVSGQVASTNSRTVTTTASGVVKQIYVKEGQKVRTGTPIMKIDLDLNGTQKLASAYSAYLSAQNNYKSTQDKIYSLQSDLVGAKNIFDNQYANLSPDDPSYIQKHNAVLTAQSAHDNLQNSLKQSLQSLESARLSYQMASAVVYAPISGTVSAISLAPGMILNPTSDSSNSSNISNKIAIVKTGATPAITVNLTEIDVPKVVVGDLATITLDALPDHTFTGKVIAIDTAGTVSSNVVNYPVTIQLDSSSESILPNMSATATIITDTKDNATIVPISAVKTVNGISSVQIMKDNLPQSINVETGLKSTTLVEIVSGVNIGDIIVTSTTSTAKTSTTSTGTSVFGNTRGFGGGMGR